MKSRYQIFLLARHILTLFCTNVTLIRPHTFTRSVTVHHFMAWILIVARSAPASQLRVSAMLLILFVRNRGVGRWCVLQCHQVDVSFSAIKLMCPSVPSSWCVLQCHQVDVSFSAIKLMPGFVKFSHSVWKIKLGWEEGGWPTNTHTRVQTLRLYPEQITRICFLGRKLN